MNRRKLFGTILGIIIWCCCIVFFTYAWYTWRSDNNSVNVTIVDEAGLEVELENDGDVIIDNIGPVLDISDGVHSGFNVTNPNAEDIEITIKLNISSIDSELLDSTFKYLLVKSVVSPRTAPYVKEELEYNYDSPVVSGNFSEIVSGMNIIKDEEVIESNTKVFYKLIFYIDGTVENNIDMIGKSMQANIIIERSDIPACYLGVDSVSYDSVDVEVSCNSNDGISSYNLSMTEGSDVECFNNYGDDYVDTIYHLCSFDTFDISDVKLSVVDSNNNLIDYSLSSEQLDEGYQLIYDTLELEYESLPDKNDILDEMYPVGSIYLSNTSTNPGNLIGGTWEAYGAGRTVIGIGSNGTNNYTTVNATGGNETVTLALANLKSHSHTITPTGTVSSTFTGSQVTTSTTGVSHNHAYSGVGTAGSSYGLTTDTGLKDLLYVTGGANEGQTGGAHTHTYTASGTVSSTFSGTSVNTSSVGSSSVSSFNVVNPYIVTYFWKRTA